MKKIDDFFYDINNKTPGCVVGVLKNGEKVFSKSYGTANLDYDIPITSDTVFHIASVSKQFAAFCIALLEEENLIDKKDDIRTYIPELKRNIKHIITIEDLIHMKSGLKDAYHTIQYVKGLTENEFLNEEELLDIAFNTEVQIFEPGDQFWYSNTNYLFLSEIIKRVTGKSLSYYADEKIFKPLNMKNSFFREDYTNIIKNRAEGYCLYDFLHYTKKQKEKFRNHINDFCISTENAQATGAGQVWSTLNDLFKWVKNFENNIIGKSGNKLIEKLFAPSKDNKGNDLNYGYGQFISERHGEKVVFHEGGSCGHNSVIYMIPERKLSIILLANTNEFLMRYYKRYNYVDVIEKIADIFLNREESSISIEKIENKEKVVQNFDKLKLVVGEYQSKKTGSIWKIALQEDICEVNINGIMKRNLVYIKDNEYKFENENVICIFEKDENNNIIKLEVESEDFENEYFPFNKNLQKGYFDRFCGEYECKKLNCSYIVSATSSGIFLKNKDRHRTSLDLEYLPTIENYFYTYQPPYIPDFYVLEFLTDENNKINAYIIRDYDGSKIEEFVFKKV